MSTTPYLLTIAGHDPTGGAGLTADLATWAALGWRGASVASALTAQNSYGVRAVQAADVELLRSSLRTLLADGEPAAIKIGMLGNAAIAEEVAQFIEARTCPVVWDPVLAASDGTPLWTQAHGGGLAMRLARRADLITPNRVEASALLDLPAWDTGALPASWIAAIRGRWLETGAPNRAVLVKGGHAWGEHSTDWFITGSTALPLVSRRLPRSAHGSGCVHSSVCAARLAEGWSPLDAATEAQLRVHAGIDQAVPIGPGRPNTRSDAQPGCDDLPWQPLPGLPEQAPPEFARLTGQPGFYPIVPDADWVLRLLEWGVCTIQLRIKGVEGTALRLQIRAAVQAAQEVPGAQLFINDHWREALDAGAYGVHLGQEDVHTADLPALNAAGLRLGLSTHTPAEIARAHALRPSYIALGPVYPTTLKAMPYRPLGLQRLAMWRQWLTPRYPVVAIGGIGLSQMPGVRATGVSGAAVVSAVTQAANPRLAVREALHIWPACADEAVAQAMV
ncbi:MAG: bifunctional hydroxymethylpyrimidine kinase/phosphomethylpyrimidine kinase [Thiomonas sp.]|jgi:hydroxymethylpyrimidine kinase/phosphomethylpyrimidine kinase/thiamine-phosphate diphosphorylase